ncbi:hypothetical protein POWCR01_000230000 [Plasmodium ovale]|uniref:PIR protein n=1 Tax=Plasmodium ovale TaxID=36330 RepID=A0A1C3KKR3_PLAOA|nr:hypothetical protein POWCR01_000230000 [Plasmodium ovale]
MSTPLRKEQFYEKCFILNNSCVQKHHAGYTDVSKCNDPVLQNIDLSLSENYKYGKNIYTVHEKKPIYYCEFLNTLINEKKHLYSHEVVNEIMIYEFTNIESLFRSKIRKKINLWNVNSEHGKTEFSEDYFHNEDISSNNTLNNTFYQPT